MKDFQILNESEKEMLLKFPVYITMLAANKDAELDETEKKVAGKLAHIKTFSCDPMLYDFYQEADKHFAKNIAELENNLPKGRIEREEAIKNDLSKLEPILQKFGEEYALKMYHSMKSFKDHVSKAHRNVLEYFIFPMPLKGITD